MQRESRSEPGSLIFQMNVLITRLKLIREALTSNPFAETCTAMTSLLQDLIKPDDS